MSKNTELPSIPLVPLVKRYSVHVITSAAKMPASCQFGPYMRVAVVEVDHHERPENYVPRRIVDLRGVRVLNTWERMAARGENTAAKRAIAEAKVFASQARLSRRRQAIAADGTAGELESFDRRYFDND